MSSIFPYTYISCPCDGIVTSEISQQNEAEEEEKTFDPRSPRASFSLYPPEHLLYCEDCHQIRCPRCTIEEILCWFCPSCLFEFASSMVRTEGNRCTRNCFNCPVCTAPLAVSSLDTEEGGKKGPWIQSCGYCNWTSLEVGLIYNKPNNIYGQLNGKGFGGTAETKVLPKLQDDQPTEAREGSDPESRFNALRAFYQSQLSASAPSNPLASPSSESYASPSNLARIMSLYTNLGAYGKKAAAKSIPMREAYDASEGLQVADLDAENVTIQKMRSQGWSCTTDREQRALQRYAPRFQDKLMPVSTLLCTKRSKRCRVCRHILVKPEAKVLSTRFRICLVAVNYIPTISMQSLQPLSSSSTMSPIGTSGIFPNGLPPLKARQFLLSLKNPMFDSVKVTLATPSRTPGKYGHKVTILCPQFEIGANTDVWDEALGEGKREKGKSGTLTKTSVDEGEAKQAEAGKVWDRGRNWTAVVVEVVCADVGAKSDSGEIEDDEDVLEIPMFVRIEYEADTAGDGLGNGLGQEKEKREKRELAYWCVLGVGKLATMGD